MVCEQIGACTVYKICYKKIEPNKGRKNMETKKESTFVRYKKTLSLIKQTVNASTKYIFLIKLCTFKYNLTTESCEHPLTLLISACYCSMSTSIIS